MSKPNNPQTNKQQLTALRQNNQKLLTEIGQMATMAESAEPDQTLKQLASQINSLSQQALYNEQNQTNFNQTQVENTLDQNNQQFLAEIGQLAGQLNQKSTNQQVKQNANQISQFANQYQANSQQLNQ